MGGQPGQENVAQMLARLDRSSLDALMRSLAVEFARLAEAQAALEARMAAFESLQAMVDRLVDAERADPTTYPARLRIDAADAMLDASGFHGLEYNAQGVPFRWTGPDRHTTFQVFVDRTAPMEFTLQFDGFSAGSPLRLLRAFVDGEQVDMTLQQTGAFHEARGVMPPRADRGGTVLTLVVPALGAAPDSLAAGSRPVGFAFLALTVEPARDRARSRPLAFKGEAALRAAE